MRQRILLLLSVLLTTVMASAYDSYAIISENTIEKSSEFISKELIDGETKQKKKKAFRWISKLRAESEKTTSKSSVSNVSVEGEVKPADVDLTIPRGATNNKNTFAVIIANENYKKETAVKFAGNDGNIMCQYLTKTLGLPERNIHFANDATLNEIYDQIDWIKQVAKAYKGEANVILYYAGHGMPDEQTGNAYLIPTDGNSSNTRTCIPLKTLYEELSAMEAKSVCVFLDACFSGAQRGDGMLMAARGVAIKAKEAAPKGNMVVFSAAQGTETAYPYAEQGHGLFTYYLLKKLQETKGNATLGELGDYIADNVTKTSIVVNGKSQTPTVSTSMPDWKSRKLK